MTIGITTRKFDLGFVYNLSITYPESGESGYGYDSNSKPVIFNIILYHNQTLRIRYRKFDLDFVYNFI
jgi:hypothetical protein